MTLRENIRRALWSVCKADILGAYSPRPVPGRRESWMRLHNLLALLRTREVFNATTLARLLKLNAKTIYRDLAFLRSQGLKIVFNYRQRTFQLCSEIPPQFTFNPSGDGNGGGR